MPELLSAVEVESGLTHEQWAVLPSEVEQFERRHTPRLTAHERIHGHWHHAFIGAPSPRDGLSLVVFLGNDAEGSFNGIKTRYASVWRMTDEEVESLRGWTTNNRVLIVPEDEEHLLRVAIRLDRMNGQYHLGDAIERSGPV